MKDTSKKLTRTSVDLGKLPDKLHHRTKARAKRVVMEQMGVKSSKAK